MVKTERDITVHINTTHARELLRLIEINCHDSIVTRKANYTTGGIEALIKDKFDGQLYRLKIEPTYKRCDESCLFHGFKDYE